MREVEEVGGFMITTHALDRNGPFYDACMREGHCALIGGTNDERLLFAVKLRRLGFVTEAVNGKRSKAFKRACDRNFFGKGGVYDLDDAEDRAWLERSDLQEVGV